MPILSLEEVDEILKSYSANEAGIASHKDNTKPQCTVAPFLIDSHEQKINSLNELGLHAKEFITHAHERYQIGVLAPPLTEEKVKQIYDFLTPLNVDLIGNPQGTAFEQQRAREWDQHWCELITHVNNEGHQLSTDEIKKIQEDILKAYRQKIIQHCVFKPKGKKSDKVDEVRVQEYLISISNCLAYYNPTDAFTYLYEKYFADFESDLRFDIQTLSRYLNISQRTEYVKKFEEILSRKTVEFVGSQTISCLFEEMTKDKEFIKQLPYLLEKGQMLKNFILNYPDKNKKNSVLSASIYEIFNRKEKEASNSLKDKHLFLLQNMLQDIAKSSN